MYYPSNENTDNIMKTVEDSVKWVFIEKKKKNNFIIFSAMMSVCDQLADNFGFSFNIKGKLSE